MHDERRLHVTEPLRVENPFPARLSQAVLQDALTPRGLFTNLFPVAFSSRRLGALKKTTKAEKEEFSNRKRPRFYQSGETLYGYGPGLDEFKDPRFNAAIVPMTDEPDFTRYLLRIGLADYFRERGYLVRIGWAGVSVIDHTDPIAKAEKGFLQIFPEFTFQAHLVEGAEGGTIFCLSIEPAWATVPAFEIGPRVAKRSDLLQSLKVVLKCEECGPHCPLHDRVDRVIGAFQEFAAPDTPLTTACTCEDYAPQPIRVYERRERKGVVSERTHVIPGQVARVASRQRRVLKLFSDRSILEREGRIWLGDLTKGGQARSGALQVRYERIQNFLARLAGFPTGPIRYSLPTGPQVELQRVPLTVEEVGYA